MRRCFEATSPTSLAGNFFLLANLITGASLIDLLDCSGAADDPTPCPLLRITAFLTSEEQVSCAAFASKAGILECANALACVLSDLVEKYSTTSNLASATGDSCTESTGRLVVTVEICRRVREIALQPLYFACRSSRTPFTCCWQSAPLGRMVQRRPSSQPNLTIRLDGFSVTWQVTR